MRCGSCLCTRVVYNAPSSLQDTLRRGRSRSSKVVERVFQDAADSLWSSHLEVEIAGLRAGTSVHSCSGDLGTAGEPDEDHLASCQWALQSTRCLVKVVSSKLGVRLRRPTMRVACLARAAAVSARRGFVPELIDRFVSADSVLLWNTGVLSPAPSLSAFALEISRKLQ